MPKIRKTRKQKSLADQRHHTDFPKISSYSLEKHTPVEKQASNNVHVLPISPSVSKHAIATGNYKYLSKDLLKTFSLTAAIVIAEILISIYTKIA